jgi:hypothetical protein
MSDKTRTPRIRLTTEEYNAVMLSRGEQILPGEEGGVIHHDKKTRTFDYEDWVQWARHKQVLKEKASNHQGNASIEILAKEDVIVLPLADLHLGSIGADYTLFMELTDLILNEPNVYFVLVGDVIDNFVKFVKNVAPMHAQVMSPKEQLLFFASWVDKVLHKLLFATWGNHEEFTERQTGLNPVQEILASRTVFFDGIGVADVRIGDNVYKIAATHRTRFYSNINLTHGLKQLARRDLPECDVYIGADKHEPAYECAPVGGKVKHFIQTGTLKVDDAYSRRYYAPVTFAHFPCFVLGGPKEKSKVVGFYRIEDALNFVSPDRVRQQAA